MTRTVQSPGERGESSPRQNPWPMVKFREFLRPNSRPYLLGAEEDANLVGMRLYGGGPFHRELKPAMRIAKKSHFVIKSGDVIFNKLFAWKGTFGIVPPELDGMFVSDKFPTYELDRAKVDAQFLRWYFRCPPLWDEAKTMSTGSAALSKLTLNPPKFLLLTMPLPPLAEQRRVVARIEELAAQIHEARTLRQQADDEAEALAASWLNSTFANLPARLRQRLSDVAEIIGGGSLPDTSLLETGPIDVMFVKVSDMNRPGNEVILRDSAIGAPISSVLLKGLRVVPANAIVFPKRGGAIATNKKRRLQSAAVLDPNMMGVFAKANQQIDPEFLFKWFNNIDLASMQSGTSVPQINKGDLAPLVIPLPPLAEQRRIVAELDALQAEVDALKRLQAETTAELDALLPAILDRAFKGEL